MDYKEVGENMNNLGIICFTIIICCFFICCAFGD